MVGAVVGIGALVTLAAVEYREGKEESAGQHKEIMLPRIVSVSSISINPPTGSSGYSTEKDSER